MVQVSFEIASRKVLSIGAQFGQSIMSTLLAAVLVASLSFSAAASSVSDLEVIVSSHYPLMTEQDVASQSIREALQLLERPFLQEAEDVEPSEVEQVARLEEALSKTRLGQPQQVANIGGQLVDLAVEGVGGQVSRFDLSLRGALRDGNFHESLKHHLKQRFGFSFTKKISVSKPDSFQLVYGFYALILIFTGVLLKKALFR